MHMHSPKQDPQRRVQDHPQSGHEFDADVSLPVTLGFGIGIVVTSVLSFIGMWFLMNTFVDAEADRAARVAPRVQQAPPPEPRLQIHPELELQAILAEQNAHLQSYGWVDQSQDRGFIAIEDAMHLIVDRRLPVRRQPRPWDHPLLWRDPSLMPVHLEEAH